jgi:hypothetical protein
MSAIDVLRSDQDPRRLVHAAQELAVSPHQQDQAALFHLLTRTDLLQRLDDDERYEGDRRMLRLRRVIDRLRRNPAGHPTLAALSADPGFLAHPSRVDLLLVASADVRPPPAAVLRLWNQFCEPDDGFVFLTIQALADNGTPEAVQFLCSKLLDPAHPDEDKVIWMRSSILEHRTDAPLLAGLMGLLNGALPIPLKLSLVEALVDWRPEEWYPVHGCVMPPPWSTASPEAVVLLDGVAAYARDELIVSARIEDKIKTMLAALPRP